MLKGEVIRLRTIREADLDLLYEFHHDIANRGDYYPIGVVSEPEFKRRFHEGGYWKHNEGMLVIVNDKDDILGHIEYFPTVGYMDELEIGYHIYSHEYAGKGVATDALRLMTGYLFDRTKYNRIRLIIHPENSASRRVAEKCGYKFEGVARGAWFHRGRNHDIEVHALLREEYYKSK